MPNHRFRSNDCLLSNFKLHRTQWVYQKWRTFLNGKRYKNHSVVASGTAVTRWGRKHRMIACHQILIDSFELYRLLDCQWSGVYSVYTRCTLVCFSSFQMSGVVRHQVLQSTRMSPNELLPFAASNLLNFLSFLMRTSHVTALDLRIIPLESEVIQRLLAQIHRPN